MSTPHAPAPGKAPLWIVVLVLILVVGGALLFWRFVTTQEPVRPWPEGTEREAQILAACKVSWLTLDPSAIVPDRPVNGDLVGWPTGSGFVFRGRELSASCTVEDGEVTSLTAGGTEVRLK